VAGVSKNNGDERRTSFVPENVAIVHDRHRRSHACMPDSKAWRGLASRGRYWLPRSTFLKYESSDQFPEAPDETDELLEADGGGVLPAL